MYAQQSPKAIKIQRSTIRRRAGSMIGPVGGSYGKKTPTIVTQPKKKKQKGAK